MRIKSVKIENLRTFKEEVVEFNDYTCFVGPNGSGKSTVLCALNLFFRNNESSGIDVDKLEQDDFHHKNTEGPVRVTVTFVDLNDEAQKDFRHYFRQGQLVVSAVASWNGQTAPVLQNGERLAMKEFAPFFELKENKGSAAQLKSVYAVLLAKFPELAKVSTMGDMAAALQDYEASRPEDCENIPSEDKFYGVSKGANLLAKYVQWVFVPAVKDASSEQFETKNSSLAKLLARTVRSRIDFEGGISEIKDAAQKAYDQLLNDNSPALSDLSKSLKGKMKTWAHPGATLDIQWRRDPDKSVTVQDPLAEILAGEGGFEGDLVRFGHGLQRSFLLALLQELATSDSEYAPTLILAVEEPELFQHPPQARHLSSVLQSLSTKNSQVMVCTHSPYFVSGKGFEDVRLVRKCPESLSSKVEMATVADVEATYARATGKNAAATEGVVAKIHQDLQPHRNEMFFASTVVFVEGLEDQAYISTYLHLLGLMDEFRTLGCHLIPLGGKEYFLRSLAIADNLGINYLAICDSDSHRYGPGTGADEGRSKQHAGENKAIQILSDIDPTQEFLTETLWADRLIMWKSDIGSEVKAEFDKDTLEKASQLIGNKFGHTGGLQKNTLFITELLIELWEKGHKSKLLEKVCETIIERAKTT